MDVWPTHQPDRGWEQMDHQSVIEIILKRAGDPDWSAIEDDLGAIANRELRRLKESAVTVLSSVLTKDGYLERKLSEIEDPEQPLANRSPGLNDPQIVVFGRGIHLRCRKGFNSRHTKPCSPFLRGEAPWASTSIVSKSRRLRAGWC